MTVSFRFVVAAAWCLVTSLSLGLGTPKYVFDTPITGAFTLTGSGVDVDPHDFDGVMAAAMDFSDDLHQVTGASGGSGQRTVVIGTLGHNRKIDAAVKSGQLKVDAIRGKWESFLIKPIGDTLYVVGSDKRGAIYGAYDLSEQIGVSPWAWWADVVPRHQGGLFVRREGYVEGPPAVKYRGIFLNDEAPDLSNWVYEKYGNYNSQFYIHVFKLLLRLKANYLWPAMWNNAFAQDDPKNQELADKFGIVMGTSHVEPMMRADKEWGRAGFTAEQWNYDKSPEELRKFWAEGLDRSKPYENIVTIGMRGKVDTPMSETANISLLERIVKDQRTLIAQHLNPDVTKVPQLWCLYKEVQEYYEKGMRVPDDVTLLWSDDNWGNLRRLPTPEEEKRSGGAGIYYHLDYVGGPRNYKWINSSPLPKIWEQMNLALAHKADRIWIVNVGHLKGQEIPTEFFLTMARRPERWPKEKLQDYLVAWATREFGPDYAHEMADIVAKYPKYNARRKPELLGPETYSRDEWGRIESEWDQLSHRADGLTTKIPSDQRDAFYELVQYPVDASANLNHLYGDVAENRWLAEAGDASANAFAKKAEQAFQRDQALSDTFNRFKNGRWDHFADQTHIGYTSWQQPDRNVMPAIRRVDGLTRVKGIGSVDQGLMAVPKGFKDGFVEQGGVISIEAAHTSRRVGADGARWEEIPDYGRTLSGMSVFPVTVPGQTPPKAAHMDYNLYLFTTGAIPLQLTAGPSLNFVSGRGLRVAVSLDDNAPQMVDLLADLSQHAWEEAVKDSVRKVSTTVKVDKPGPHVLHVWVVDPGVVLEKIILGDPKPSYLGPPETYHVGK